MVKYAVIIMQVWMQNIPRQLLLYIKS